MALRGDIDIDICPFLDAFNAGRVVHATIDASKQVTVGDMIAWHSNDRGGLAEVTEVTLGSETRKVIYFVKRGGGASTQMERASGATRDDLEPLNVDWILEPFLKGRRIRLSIPRGSNLNRHDKVRWIGGQHAGTARVIKRHPHTIRERDVLHVQMVSRA